MPKADWYDLKTFRAFRNDLEKQNLKALGPPGPEINESYLQIAMRDEFSSELKVFKPTKPPADGSPLIVLAFGGGFAIGSNQQLTAISRTLTKLFGATVVNLSYRLAPEHKFPTGVNDAWDTVKWCAANASSLGADPTKAFLLGGVSAGGNITAVIAQKALDEKLSPPLSGLWLSVPLVFPSAEQVPEKYKDQWFSHEQNKDAPILDANAIAAIVEYVKQNLSFPIHPNSIADILSLIMVPSGIHLTTPRLPIKVFHHATSRLMA